MRRSTFALAPTISQFENRVRALKEVAERRGWSVVEVYRDAGISGAKGRDQRPGLDALLNDASRRKFDGDGVGH